MSQKVLEDITKTGIRLLLEEPFFGHIFSGMLRETEIKTDSISISVLEKRPTLSINPTFWDELLDGNEKVGYIKHQLLHLALKHPFKREEYLHKHIFDLASDLVVNQYINPIHLPMDAITLEKYPKLKKLAKGKDVGFYYRKILEINDQNDPSDHPLPDENNRQLKQHQDWNSFAQSNRMEQRMMESALEDALVQAAERTDEKLQGALPGSLLRLIQEKLNGNQKQVDWRRVLRLFLGSGKTTYLKNTIRRPSKRYGTTPGIQVKNRQKVLVAIDTSGSITLEEVASFFKEMNHIYKQGSEILVVECDAQIQRTYSFKNQIPLEIKGGGGTNFTPVIQYANTQFKPDLLVYFTDGFGAEPEELPRCPILWLISDDGIKEEDATWNLLPGRKIKML